MIANGDRSGASQGHSGGIANQRESARQNRFIAEGSKQLGPSFQKIAATADDLTQGLPRALPETRKPLSPTPRTMTQE